METLVVVPQLRNHNQYCGRRRGQGLAPALGSFREKSGAGLLPSPRKSCIPTGFVSKRAFSASFSPKTPSPNVNETNKTLKKPAACGVIQIPVKVQFEEKNTRLVDDLRSSELWAGPAYMNSPPPSSLPMPEFSLRPRRTVSLDLPSASAEFDLPLLSNSAPASPTIKRSPSPNYLFESVDSQMIMPVNLFDCADSATKTLRRILNLDNADE